jgi:hypothetical protein
MSHLAHVGERAQCDGDDRSDTELQAIDTSNHEVSSVVVQMLPEIRHTVTWKAGQNMEG